MAVFGKNIIENLTEGMYENSYTVYREYIQNSADSIDKAIERGIMTADDAAIDIYIDSEKRRISIHDNAMGIPKDEFLKRLTDIADSQKDPTKDKGFRGIGRLAGLAYCDKLIFKSSAKGENVVSIMEWNGIKLREVLGDSTKHPSASDLVDELITPKTENCEENEHFFEVIMEHIIPESNELLDEHKVIKYLQAVAPVPYANKFIFRSKIYDFAKEHNLKIDEYNVSVNGNQLFKQYSTQLYEGTENGKKAYDEITDIEFKEFRLKDNSLLGWLWFGVSRFEKQIPVINEMRGIRLRKGNIQIGDENTFTSHNFHKEPRGNLYFVGELFAVDKNLLPNARRDYFKVNSVQKEFEDTIKPYFYTDMYNCYRGASDIIGAMKRQLDYTKAQQEYDTAVANANFINEEEQEKAKQNLEEKKKKAEEGAKKIEQKRQKIDPNSAQGKIFSQIQDKYQRQIDAVSDKKKDVPEQPKENKKFLSQKLSRYTKQEQKLITRIYAIISTVLAKDSADQLINKIQEELSK